MKNLALVALFLTFVLVVGAATELIYLGPSRAEASMLETAQEELAALRERRLTMAGQLSGMPPVDVSQSDALAFTSQSSQESLLALQEVLRSAVTSTGGTLLALQAEEMMAEAGMTRMRVTLGGTFSETGLLEFLRQIEMFPTPIVIERLDIGQAVMAQMGATTLDVTAVAGALHRNAI
jgi:hypothetical protein